MIILFMATSQTKLSGSVQQRALWAGEMFYLMGVAARAKFPYQNFQHSTMTPLTSPLRCMLHAKL